MSRAKSHILPNINVTPLIDVLLVLLIIFMVVSPLRPARFKALIPQPSVAEQHAEPNPLTLVVTIDRELRLKLNQQEEMGSVDDPLKLTAELAGTFQRRKEAHTYKHELAHRTDLTDEEKVERTVFIKAARSIPYGEVAKVIDGIKGAGAQPVGLQIDDLDQ
jgi:biopolymer transport protein ExbD